MHIRARRSLVTLALVGAAVGYASLASGAGFAIIEASTRGLGSAFAGGAAAADDATTVFFNPAGMTRLPGTRIDAAAHVIVPSADFTNSGSVLNPRLGGAPLSGPNGQDPSVTALVPNLYATHAVNDRLRIGLGVNAPFGLKTSYDLNWVGRYHALTSRLTTINVNPSAAFKVTDWLSIGAGANAQYIDARLSKAIDKSAVCLGRAGAAACAPLGLVTPGTPATDGNFDLRGDDWSFGYNVGVLLELSKRTRFGLHYRSKISHELEGTAAFGNTADLAAIAPAIGLAGAFANQGVKAKITMPETVSASFYHQLAPKLAMMGDVTWTRWTRFQKLILNFSGGQPQNVTPEEWDNSFRYALGLAYQHSPKLALRGGVAYDESPIPNSSLRTPRLPGDDRTWVTVGAGYQPSDRLSFELGYAHLFVGDVKINNVDVDSGHVLVGKYDSDVNIFSGQVRYLFR